MINECLGKYEFQLANQELRYNSACGVNQPISCFCLHELYRESCIELILEAYSLSSYFYGFVNNVFLKFKFLIDLTYN